MAEPYLQEFTIGDFIVTSVVLDQADFDKLVTDLEKSGLSSASQADFAAIRAAKHIPLMTHGTKTAWVFEHFGVKTAKMSVIVRGTGPALLNNILGRIGDGGQAQE